MWKDIVGIIRATAVERELTDHLPGNPETGECSYRPVSRVRRFSPAMNVSLLDGHTLTDRVAIRPPARRRVDLA